MVLVVDDERSVRTLAQRVLERAGFRVLTAADGVEAVESVRQHEAAISIVLLDLMMPRLGGEQAMKAMRQVVPALPVVFMSGYSDDSVAEWVRALENVDFLPKPYSNVQLITTISALLGRSASDRKPQPAV